MTGFIAKSAALLILLAIPAFAQLQGITDIHLHAGPDSTPRRSDVFEVTRLARDAGLRAIVLKNHYWPTPALAALANKLAGGVEVVGSLVLNRSVGGLNSEAIVQAMAVEGGNLRIVWMPTLDAAHYKQFMHDSTPGIALARNGRLLPATLEVLKTIAKYKLALATGHCSPAESLLLIRAARALGIERIVVTHPLFNAVGMNMKEMQEAARMGAYLEFCANQVMPTVPAEKRSSFEGYIEAIHTLGAEHSILSGDLGQVYLPTLPDGWKLFLGMLQGAGITAQEIDIMARQNPAKLLALH